MKNQEIRAIVFDNSYYKEVMSAFGYSPIEFEPISFALGSLSKEDLQCQWLCHMNGAQFSRMAQAGRKVIVTTGFGLSGIPHMGTLSQILKALRLQRAGIPVQIVLGDLDAYNGKNVDLAYTHYLAARYSTFIQELGFRNEPPSTLRNQHDSLSILRSAYLLGNHVSDSELESAEEDLHDLYSQKQKVDKEMTYRRKLSLSLMIADFIELLTTAGFDGVLISLGIDEHRYVDLGRTIFRRQQAQDAPLAGKIYSAMYSSIIGGFNGYPKMSKSFPESGLSVDSTRDQIHHMILHGERLTPYPETNVVYQMISSVSLYGNDQILEAHRECGRQSMRWKAIKEDYANHLCELCRHWPSG